MSCTKSDITNIYVEFVFLLCFLIISAQKMIDSGEEVPAHKPMLYCHPSDEDYTVTDCLPNSYGGSAHTAHASYSRSSAPVLARPDITHPFIADNTSPLRKDDLFQDVLDGNGPVSQDEDLSASQSIPSSASRVITHPREDADTVLDDLYSAAAGRPDLDGRSKRRTESSEPGSRVSRVANHDNMLDCNPWRNEHYAESEMYDFRQAKSAWSSSPDWTSPVVVDGGGMLTEDVVTLQQKYRKLLGRHHQFVLSNAELHEDKENLEERLRVTEIELEEARVKMEVMEKEKKLLMDEMASSKRLLSVFESQWPLVDTEARRQMSDEKRNAEGSDEWTSSLKEELRQTIMLAISQQQELHNLYGIIKQQNEAIKQLNLEEEGSRISREKRRQPPAEVDMNGSWKPSEETMTQKELVFRHMPEGSSVTGNRKQDFEIVSKTLVDPSGEKEIGSRTSAVPFTLRNIFGQRSGKNPPERKHQPPSNNRTQATTGSTSSKSQSKRSKSATADLNGERFCEADPTKNAGRPGKLASTGTAHASSSSSGLGSEVIKSGHEAEISEFELGNSNYVFVPAGETEMRICPLCSKEFSNMSTTIEEFVMHVSQCVPLPAPTEFRQCPVCQQKFDKNISDRLIEMHVNEHFDEDRFLCVSPLDNID